MAPARSSMGDDADRPQPSLTDYRAVAIARLRYSSQPARLCPRFKFSLDWRSKMKVAVSRVSPMNRPIIPFEFVFSKPFVCRCLSRQ
jgi:hypothetical protein